MLRLSRVWLRVVTVGSSSSDGRVAVSPIGSAATAPSPQSSSSSRVAGVDARTSAARLASLVHALQHTPAYLRHAPPSLYVTCDAHDCHDADSASGAEVTTATTRLPQRHAIRLLDCACAVPRRRSSNHNGNGHDDNNEHTSSSCRSNSNNDESNTTSTDDDDVAQPVPHTDGVYLLSSTAIDDVDFADATSVVNTLVGVPAVRSLAHARAFVRQYDDALARVRLVALPEVTPTSGAVLRQLHARLPHVRVVCSAFAAAFLSDMAFFHGVRKALLRTHHRADVQASSLPWSPDAIEFAALPPAVLLVPDGNGSNDDVYVSLTQHSRDVDDAPMSSGVATTTAATAAAMRLSSTPPAGRSLRVLRVAAAADMDDDDDDLVVVGGGGNGSGGHDDGAQQQQQQRRRWRRRCRAQLPHYFTHHSLFFYDSAFDCVFVGRALSRLPWLPHVVPSCRRAAVLPLPPLTAAQAACSAAAPQRTTTTTSISSSTSTSSTRTSSQGGGSAHHNAHDGSAGAAGLLLEVWRAPAAARAIAAALRRVPAVQHICSSSYGELPGDVEDTLAAVDASAQQLEQLRSRLSRRLATDTQRDGVRWSHAMLQRVVDEVLCRRRHAVGSKRNDDDSSSSNNSSSDNNSSDHAVGDDDNDDDDADSRAATAAVAREVFVAWAATHVHGVLATAMTQAALSLPPRDADAALHTAAAAAATTTSTLTTRPHGDDDADHGVSSRTHDNSSSDDDDDNATARELCGAAGVRLLCALFDKKRLHGLTSTVQRQEIDVRVFAAMTADELGSVFRATFGVVKRLELLQGELKAQLARLAQPPPPRASPPTQRRR